MLRKSRSSGQNNDGRKKSVPDKEGAFGKNWGKLGQPKAQAPTDKALAVSSSKSELNASILQALNAVDEAEAKVTANHKKISAAAAPVSQSISTITATSQTSSTAKTEATATGLGSWEVLNVMWEHLELMATQYNNIVGPGPFHLKLTRETAGKSRASMSTLTHSLVLIPDVDAVRLYVLPIELNRGDEYSQGPQFEPNSIVLMTQKNGRTEWTTKTGTVLTATVMNSMCRSLFQSLIEQTASLYA